MKLVNPNSFIILWSLRDLNKEDVKGIDTRTRGRGSRVKYLHKP